MIDALFGSKTRVKLLHLFLNNPGQSFYVREITRIIEEQINSVRRELANMLKVGIITSNNADNKLYYQVDQRYDYYVPLRAIFSDTPSDSMPAVVPKNSAFSKYTSIIEGIAGVRIAVLSGVLVKGSASSIDLLLVGDIVASKIKLAIKGIESDEGREINYSVMSYDDFYYRLSVRDRFIMQIINGKHVVAIDTDNVLNKVQ